MSQDTLLVGDGYCIDTNALIDLGHRTYPFAVFPSLKAKVENLIQEGRLISPVQVIDELLRGTDDLGAWAKQVGLFSGFDQNQSAIVAEIMQMQPPLVDINKQTDSADPFVIALAETKGFTVVTSEVWCDSQKKTKIPNVCKARGVRCLNVLEFIEEQKWQM